MKSNDNQIGKRDAMTPEEKRQALQEYMARYRREMIEVIEECAGHKDYKNLSGQDALMLVAQRLKTL